jgi:Ni,Fe-hydrogenase III small subunit
VRGGWFLRGLRAGIRTERPPDGNDVSTELSAGLPVPTSFATAELAARAAERCPTDALVANAEQVDVTPGRCIYCMRCTLGTPQSWRHDVRWTVRTEGMTPLDRSFARSIHVRIVDAGDCGACLSELVQLNGPSYNLHRFGIFITPTPRQADVLLVVGPGTAHMQEPLRAAYDAMPEPKRVVAVGACAATGGLFGPSVMCAGGAGEVVPVDLVVPGCPPPPLAVIEALRTVCGQIG